MLTFKYETIKTVLHQLETPSETTIDDWYFKNDIVGPGDNFGSDVCRLIIEYKKRGTPRKNSFFCKLYRNCSLHDFHEQFGFYKKEYLMHTEILPEIDKLNPNESFAPKFYDGNEEDFMILQDLSNSGYKMGNRLEQLDYDHCKLVFEYLGKFHGYSVHLNKMSKIPEFIKEDQFYFHLNEHEILSMLYHKAMEYFVEQFDPSLKHRYANKLSYFRDNSVELLVEEMRGSPDSFKVLNHGDCWINNILFKYDEHRSPKELKFVDFQMSRWASPVFDILYFTLTSMKYEVFEHHFVSLLNVYLSNLNEILYSINVPEYTMDDLCNDIDNVRGFVLVTCASILPTLLNDPENTLNPNDMIEGKVDPDESNARTLFQNTRYKKIVTKWFEYYAQKGIFDD